MNVYVCKRKHSWVMQTTVRELSNAAVTFLGCLEFHSLNFKHSDLKHRLTLQVNTRTTKSAMVVFVSTF